MDAEERKRSSHDHLHFFSLHRERRGIRKHPWQRALLREGPSGRPYAEVLGEEQIRRPDALPSAVATLQQGQAQLWARTTVPFLIAKRRSSTRPILPKSSLWVSFLLQSVRRGLVVPISHIVLSGCSSLPANVLADRNLVEITRGAMLSWRCNWSSLARPKIAVIASHFQAVKKISFPKRKKLSKQLLMVNYPDRDVLVI
ncbi:hypothetical protein ANCDUO_02761 [Ancylostoma duodenale]|uniref:Uncharacterized protein n=1 Tax=Ancylostoma duodenale TaxID=51022 RepID=A0A0C2HBP6_9BILA|nr:hypothetical protein ANCDUO_02761 [Ancylostoma duodenale]